MKNIIKTFAVATLAFSMTGCIQEYDPQSSTVSEKQVQDSPTAFQNMVDGITSTLVGQFSYRGNDDKWGNDFGYPTFYLMRDVQGQDILQPFINWYDGFYISQYLGPTYAYPQMPWTYYFGWIKSCNDVIAIAGENPQGDRVEGAGIAHAMRALYYLDLARMYAPKTYAKDKNAETVPIMKENMTTEQAAHNKRATNEQIYAYILSDLDKAEKYLANYTRTTKTSPDLSVVYGLKARTYLTMEDWANARKYAKMAQKGYNIMSGEQYTDRMTGFNTPNDAWMLCATYKLDDPNIRLNDGDSSWGSQMCLEVDPETSGCGYAANYGQFWLIDRHLYETIPQTDVRKKCFVDFAIDDLKGADDKATKAMKLKALEAYTDYPAWVYNTGYNTTTNYVGVGGLPLKFRLAGGEAGRHNQMLGFAVSVPMMRVEEMYLIEAEAAGMMNEAEGIALLTKFAKMRDADYVYGKHNEAYGNTSTSKFQNECWWQRRVEFWGEGLATFDIKRLNKGIIRSYPKSNHVDGYRWNTTATPEWMNWCIVQTETNYNVDCTNNPAPVAPTGNSPEHKW